MIAYGHVTLKKYVVQWRFLHNRCGPIERSLFERSGGFIGLMVSVL